MNLIGTRWKHRAARTGQVAVVVVVEELPHGYVRVVPAREEDGNRTRIWRVRYLSSRNVESDGHDTERVTSWERHERGAPANVD